MNSWTEAVSRLLTWKGALPRWVGRERIYVHLSAILSLPLAAAAFAFLLQISPIDGDWRATAFTLPIVWVCSLSIRIIAQWLAVGSHGDDFEMVVGPVGNVSTEYENLSGPTMLSYAVAGQSATLLIGLLGVLVLGAVTTTPPAGITLARLLDFQTGWSGHAWASQIVWVNGFLFLLHLLPAAPLDSRALLVGWCRVSNPALSSGAVNRLLASTDSHFGIGLAGFSLAMIITRLSERESVGLWYVLLLVSIYLLTVSQIETYQAQQAEQMDAAGLQRNRTRRTSAPGPLDQDDEVDNFGDVLEAPSAHEVLDIDEILRKLHREGQDALSAFEKEALLSASRQLQARRQSGS